MIIKHAPLKDPLNMRRTTSNETTLIFEIPSKTNLENVIIAPRRKKTSFNLHWLICEQ